MMKSAVYFQLFAVFLYLFTEIATQSTNLQQLSYDGSEQLPPYRPPTTSTTTTVEPPTTKSGFFGGIKNWFRKTPTTETPTTTTSTTTARSVNIPKQSTTGQSSSSFSPSPTSSSQRPSSTNSGRRDYVNSNAPGSPQIPLSPPVTPQVLPSSSFPTPSSPTNGGRRDYVNPSLSTTKSPMIKEDFPALPPPRGGQPQSTASTTSTTGHSAWNSRPDSPQQPGSPSRTNAQSVWGNQPLQTGGGSMVSFVQTSSTSTTTRPNTRTSYPRPGQDKIQVNLATDNELTELSETLISKDVNNLMKYITVNLQGKTRSYETKDEAPNPLITIDSKAFEISTVAKMVALFNNYELDTTVNEYVTPIEKKEENEFVDAVLGTSVMRQAMLFLQNKGIVTADPQTHRELLKTIWFSLYSRGGGRIGSSGFEHIFLAEWKNGTVTGLHNVLYFSDQEQKGNIDYKGYMKTLDFGNKGSILKYRFTFNGLSKPVNAMFIGTSPELELALYTVCFQVRADNDCPISLNGHRFNMPTYAWRYRGKRLVGSGFPEI